MIERDTERDDQAAELRKLFDEVQGANDLQAEKNQDSTEENDSVPVSEPTREIDILNLPPRKEVHSNTKKRTSFKISRPLVRLSTVIIVLAIIIFVAYYLWGAELIQPPLHE